MRQTRKKIPAAAALTSTQQPADFMWCHPRGSVMKTSTGAKRKFIFTIWGNGAVVCFAVYEARDAYARPYLENGPDAQLQAAHEERRHSPLADQRRVPASLDFRLLPHSY